MRTRGAVNRVLLPWPRTPRGWLFLAAYVVSSYVTLAALVNGSRFLAYLYFIEILPFWIVSEALAKGKAEYLAYTTFFFGPVLQAAITCVAFRVTFAIRVCRRAERILAASSRSD